jgi:hypothetical protein
VDGALNGQPAPQSRCYVYDSGEHALLLESWAPVKNFPVKLQASNKAVLVDTTYHELVQMDLSSTNKWSGKKSNFTLFVGTQGALRGVPVQIRYQPNWWFQVVLNLRPDKTNTPSSAVASR